MTALRAFSSSGLEKVSSVRLVFLFSSEDPGPRHLAAMEPSACPSKFQDLAEPEPLEPEAAPISKVATRAARLLSICSTFVILAVLEATVCESVWTQFSILDAFCKKSGSYK